MSDFDPYHKWLGIPETERPISEYRLLALVDFESDREVISAAAERQTIYLRTLQAGEHEVLVAQLLNEVSQARVTLLNANQKAEYDEQLRKQQTPEPESEPTPPIPVVQTPTPAPSPVVVRGTVTQEFPVSVVQTANRPRRRKRKEIWKRPAVIGVSVVGVIGVLALGINAMFYGDTIPVGNDTPDQSVAQMSLDNEVPRMRTAGEKSATETLSSPNDFGDAALEAAVVSVERLEPVPFTIKSDPTLIPPVLQSATRWRCPEMTTTSQDNAVLRFKVIESGEVYLVAHWKFQGGKDGGWDEERLTREQLIERGWKDLGQCAWDREVYLLKRQVKKGESYVLRTNKYWPPSLIIPRNPN